MLCFHFFPCLGTSFPQHSYIFATLLSFSYANLQTFQTHSWFKFYTLLGDLLLCICFVFGSKFVKLPHMSHLFPSCFLYFIPTFPLHCVNPITIVIGYF